MPFPGGHAFKSLQQMFDMIRRGLLQDAPIIILHLPPEILQQLGSTGFRKVARINAPTSVACCGMRVVPLWHPRSPEVAFVTGERVRSHWVAAKVM
jgi:hypothetical protein